jgi:hypothetical protein
MALREKPLKPCRHCGGVKPRGHKFKFFCSAECRMYGMGAAAIKENQRNGRVQKMRGWPARKKWLRDHPESKLLAYTKTSAWQKSLEHNIDRSDLAIPESCPVLGIPLFFTPGKRTSNTPTVDRINSTLGYIKGNVVVVSWRANDLKKDASVDELIRIANFYRRAA